MKLSVIIASLLLITGLASADSFEIDSGISSFGQQKPSEFISVKAVPSHNTLVKNGTFHVALEIQLKEGWAYYSPRPGKSDDFEPLAASIAATSDSAAIKMGEPLWPAHKPYTYRVGDQSYVNNAYSGKIVVFVPVEVTQTAQGKAELRFEIQGQGCGEDKCVRLEKTVALTTVDLGPTAITNPQWGPDLDEALNLAKPVRNFPTAQAGAVPPTLAVGLAGDNFGLAAGFGLALLAGLILNIMPCVLPVIPLKVLGIVQQAKESRRRFVTLGLAFAAGIILFFVGIAAVNIVLKVALSSAFQWGEHFQSTFFRAGMAMLLVALAVNLFGLYTVLPPRRAAQAEGRLSAGDGYLSSVAMGLLTGVLATPCSFAILTAAMAFAQSQTLLIGSLVIVTIGIGMALPYALLTAMPKLVERIPRPGRWMELFRQAMGFVLLLVAVWLIATTSGDAWPFWLVGYCVVLAMCLWIWGTWTRYDDTLKRKILVRGLAVALAVGAGFSMLAPARQPAVVMQPFDQAMMEQAKREGRPVLVEFTASWCLTCKTVEKLVYDDPAVADVLRKNNVLVLKGDVTTQQMPAEAFRRTLGEPIPVTVVYLPGKAEPVRLRGVFSSQDLISLFNKLNFGQ